MGVSFSNGAWTKISQPSKALATPKRRIDATHATAAPQILTTV